MAKFQQLKQECLNALDKSPKGSIDEPLIPLLNQVNASQDHFTTSCCSGRIAVFLDHPLNDQKTHAKGSGRWLFVSHAALEDTQDLPRALFGPHALLQSDTPESDAMSVVYLKFEPVVIHITSKDIDSGSRLLRVALQAGFRNSGLVLSSSNRVTMAIRCSPSHLNVPIALADDRQGTLQVKLLAEPNYLRFLIQAANKAMQDNLGKIARLTVDIKQHLEAPASDWEDAETRRERKRQEGLARQALKHASSPIDTHPSYSEIPILYS